MRSIRFSAPDVSTESAHGILPREPEPEGSHGKPCQPESGTGRVVRKPEGTAQAQHRILGPGTEPAGCTAPVWLRVSPARLHQWGTDNISQSDNSRSLRTLRPVGPARAQAGRYKGAARGQ